MSLPGTVAAVINRHVTRRGPFAPRDDAMPAAIPVPESSRPRRWSISLLVRRRRGLRTELTVHDPRDFGVGRKLENLSVLRKRGFATNRRLLDVQRTSQDFAMSEALFREVTGPRSVDNQRASALKFGDPLVLALFSVLVLFCLLPGGFRSRDLREHVAPLLGDDPSLWTQGRLTSQQRRLRLHGLIHRIEGTQRYQVTQRGYRTALWFTRCHARLLRPALAEILADNSSPSSCPSRRLAQAFHRLDQEITHYLAAAHLTAAA